MIANIALDDGLILPHSANPTGSNVRERHDLVRNAGKGKATVDGDMKKLMTMVSEIHASQSKV
jgi:hypothetical protein